MKCPKCGGAPTDQILMSMPVQYQCSQCDYYGPEGPWMESAKKAHAERLQAARDEVGNAKEWLFEVGMSDETIAGVTALIDAMTKLALLENKS